jgi:hypothetical protein
MENHEKNEERELVFKARGRAYVYSDHSVDFRPETGERGTLYETVGKPVKDGNLQMSANSYKVQALVSRKCTDPAAELRQKVNQLLEPLDKAVETERLERATLIGSTPHANVYATKDKIQVVFTVSRNEPNPDLASIDPKIAKKNGIKLTLNPDETIVKEIVPVCSIINSNSQTLRSKSTPKKTTVK